MPSVICGRAFKLGGRSCGLPAGHRGHHKKSAADAHAASLAIHRRYYANNRDKLVQRLRDRRKNVPRTVLATVIRAINGAEYNWRLRLVGKIRRMDGKIVDKPLAKGEMERVRVQLSRIEDRRANAPATAFLRLPRIAA